MLSVLRDLGGSIVGNNLHVPGVVEKFHVGPFSETFELKSICNLHDVNFI